MLKVEQFMDIRLLSRLGHSIRDSARRTGRSRNTVRRMLRTDTPPELSTPDRANALDTFVSAQPTPIVPAARARSACRVFHVSGSHALSSSAGIPADSRAAA